MTLGLKTYIEQQHLSVFFFLIPCLAETYHMESCDNQSHTSQTTASCFLVSRCTRNTDLTDVSASSGVLLQLR